MIYVENYDISKNEVEILLEDTSEESKLKIMNAIDERYFEGEKKGIQKGIEKGIQKGVERGRHNEKVQAVKRMVEKELPNLLITEVLNVTEEFIKGVVEGTITEME